MGEYLCKYIPSKKKQELFLDLKIRVKILCLVFLNLL